jgi:hypothetical protein
MFREAGLGPREFRPCVVGGKAIDHVEPFRAEVERLGRLVFGTSFEVEIDSDLRICGSAAAPWPDARCPTSRCPAALGGL